MFNTPTTSTRRTVVVALLSTLALIVTISTKTITTNAFVQNNLHISTSITTSSVLFSSPDEVADISAEEAMQRTRSQLQRMQQSSGKSDGDEASGNPIIDEKFKEYLSFPANEIKRELKSVGLLTKGRKPDLARRLAEYEYRIDHPDAPAYYNTKSSGRAGSDDDDDDAALSLQESSKYLEPKKSNKNKKQDNNNEAATVENGILNKFCGIKLSETAGKALGKAQFTTPTPIQKNGLPLMMKGESVVLHAETGSGKTLAYLLPITEAIWKDELANEDANGFVDMNEDNDLRYGFILTPTRELAAQVAGVASALAPPGSVRLISHPTDLMSEARYWKERRGSRTTDGGAIDLFAEEDLRSGRSSPPRLFIGSAKSILHSLYGDGRMPASPTRKPLAKEMLSKTRWIVLDEVDRLLNTKSKKGLSNNQRGRSTRGGSSKEHEKPAAILTSAVTRRTLGRAQVISASATVGRSLKRELSRVLGLSPKEYPRVIQGTSSGGIISDEDDDETTFVGSSYSEPSSTEDGEEGENNPNHVNRAVTIPNSVTNYVLAVDTSSTGKLLTNAFFVVKNLNENGKKKNQKTLLVLTKGCGISTKNAIGALTHFNCQPEPQSLLDVLQNADGSDQLMDVHRQVTGSDGIGEDTTSYFDNEDTATATAAANDEDDDDSEGFLLVTGEDTVRGMHIANLDTVVVVGRPAGPDEYIHIAGRTGRAGRSGKVISVLSEQHTAAIKGWETILNIEFKILDSMNDISSI
jgi:hypothetical protein